MLLKYRIKKLLKQNNQKKAFLILILLFIVALVFVGLMIAKAVFDNALENRITIKNEMQKGLQKNEIEISKGKAKKQSNVNYTVILQKNIFGNLNDTGSSSSNFTKTSSQMPLALIGTFLTSGNDPYAIIENTKDKNQDAFGVGDNIFKIATLVSIHKNKVEINRDGSIEVLKIDDFDSDAASELDDANTQYLDKGEVDKALSNLPLVMTQARAIPYWQEGKAIGLRLFAIKQGSIFEKIGLKNGDIIKDINGKQLGDFSKAMEIFEELKNETSLRINLERNKQQSVLQYKIR